MGNFFEEMDPFDKQQLYKIITKCDPTYEAIYAIMRNMSFISSKVIKRKTVQVAQMTPYKMKTINIINQPAILIQYLYNHENFIKDKRKVVSQYSLEQDIAEIKDRILPEVLNSKDPLAILSVYNDLMISSERQIVMFGYNRHTHLLSDSIVEALSNNFQPGMRINITFTNIMVIHDPIDMRPLYSKGSRLIKDFHRQCLDNICLMYVLLKLVHGKTDGQINKFFDDCYHTDPLTNIAYSSKVILSKITMDHMKQYSYTITENKIVSYLKAVLLQDTDALYELVNTVYSFTYRYLQIDKPVGGVYLGRTIVTYTHYNTTIEAVYDKDLCKVPMMFVNKHYSSVADILYNIGLRLTGQISMNDFEADPHKKRVNHIKGCDILSIKNFLYDRNVTAVIEEGKDGDKIIKLYKVDPEKMYLPIFLINRLLKRQGDRHIAIKKIIPKINTENISVFLGRSKLYTMPYWKCHQYDNMTYCGTLLLHGVAVNQYLIHGVMEKYLLHKRPAYLNDVKIEENSYDYIISTLVDTIKKQKIYSFDFTQIFDQKSELDSLFQSKGTDMLHETRLCVHNKDVYIPNQPPPDNVFTEDITMEEKTTKIKSDETKKIDNIFAILGDPILEDDLISDDEYPSTKFDKTIESNMNVNDNPGTSSSLLEKTTTKQNLYCISGTTLAQVLGEPVYDDYLIDDELTTNEDGTTNISPRHIEHKQRGNFGFDDIGVDLEDDDTYIGVPTDDEDEIHDSIPRMTTLLNMKPVETNDDFLCDNEITLQQHRVDYIEDDIQNMKYGNVDPEDIFVVNPRLNRNDSKNHQGITQGYMVKRLKRLQPLNLIILEQRHSIANNPNYLTITNFIQNGNNLISCWLNRMTPDDELFILFSVKTLLCNTFLTDPTGTKNKRTFRVDVDNNIKLCCWYRNVYTDAQFKKLKQMGLYIESCDDMILVVQTKKQFYEKIKSDMIVEPMQKIHVSPKIDERLTKILQSINTRDEEEELLSLLE
jgi:hypothetical protein